MIASQLKKSMYRRFCGEQGLNNSSSGAIANPLTAYVDMDFVISNLYPKALGIYVTLATVYHTQDQAGASDVGWGLFLCPESERLTVNKALPALNQWPNPIGMNFRGVMAASYDPKENTPAPMTNKIFVPKDWFLRAAAICDRFIASQSTMIVELHYIPCFDDDDVNLSPW